MSVPILKGGGWARDRSTTIYTLEYLLFGKGQELFLAHQIAAPPDFDQVLSVKLDGHPFTDDELAKGVIVAFPGKKNTVAGRLKAQQRAEGEVTLGAGGKAGTFSLRRRQ